MKCQQCVKEATHHITEIVDDEPLEYHVCDEHAPDLSALNLAAKAETQPRGIREFWSDPKLCEAFFDMKAHEGMAGHFLPGLCAALLDSSPQVKLIAIAHLMCFGCYGQAALGPLRDMMHDDNKHVRKAAEIAVEFIESGQAAPGIWRWFF